MPWKSESTILTATVAFFMTLLGAVASYAWRVLNGAIFSWVTLTLQVIISIFAGMIMVMVAIHYGWPTEIIGGACGMAGWCGASFIKTLEQRVLNRAAGGSSANQ